MGSSGWSFPLRPIAGQKQATLAKVRTLVLDALHAIWKDVLPWSSFEATKQWAFFGPDSLLTIGMDDEVRQVPEKLTFWFYDSVEWPLGLAHHWLFLALAWGRRDFELALAKGGFTIETREWPTVVRLLGARPKTDSVFVTLADAVGEIGSETIEWMVKAKDEERNTPIASLDESSRTKVETIVGSRTCGCPFCTRIRFLSSCDEHSAVDGYRATPIFVGKEWFHEIQVGALMVMRGFGRAAWVLRMGEHDEPWTTVEAISSDKRDVQALLAAPDAIVATLGFPSPKTPRVYVTSTDGGVTWSPPENSTLPQMKSPRFIMDHQSSLVFAFDRRESRLFRSEDGGRTWRPIDVTLDGEPIVSLRCIRRRGDRLYALAAKKKTGDFACVSDDGASFRTIKTGVWADELDVRSNGTICVFGRLPNTKTSAVARSVDGDDWSVTEVGIGRPMAGIATATRWFFSAADHGVYTSADDGVTWKCCVKTKATDLARVPKDPNAVLVRVGQTLLHVAST